MDSTQDMKQESAMKGSALNMPGREKYWSEIGLEEKVERLRTLLKSLLAENETLKSSVRDIESILWSHDHEGKDVVVRVGKEDSHKLKSNRTLFGSPLPSELSKKNDEVYI